MLGSLDCFEAESSGNASRGEHVSILKLDDAVVCHVLTLNPVEELGAKAFTENRITPKSLYGFRDLRSVNIEADQGSDRSGSVAITGPIRAVQ